MTRESAEGDDERGVQGFGAITFQYDGNGVGPIGLVAFILFVLLALLALLAIICLAGHKSLLQGESIRLNHITRLRVAGWIEWRTTEALDQILNWPSFRRRFFCSR